MENEDVVGAAPTGDAPTTSEWSTSLLLAKVPLILEAWRYYLFTTARKWSPKKNGFRAILAKSCRKIACVSAQLMLFCSHVKPTQNKVYLILSYIQLSGWRANVDSTLVISGPEYWSITINFKSTEAKHFAHSTTVPQSKHPRWPTSSDRRRLDIDPTQKCPFDVNSRVFAIFDTQNFVNMTCLMPRKLWYSFLFSKFRS